jgi:1,4-alpha-glucan branching enzyme
MRNFTFILALLVSFAVKSQVVTTDPAFPIADQPVTITVDVTGTSLDKYPWDNSTKPVYIWTWIHKAGSADIDAPTNVNPATSAQAAAKCTRISTNPDKYQITFTPTTFFNKTAAEIPQIGLKLKTINWSDNKQTDVDKFIQFTQGFTVKFTQPTQSSFLVNTGDQIPITLNASSTADFTVSVGGVTKATSSQTTSITYTHTVTETSGTVEVKGTAVHGTDSKSVSFFYTLRTPTINATRPNGIIDGINYNADPTKVTLSFWAPGKSSAYVIGDFTNWNVDAGYQMKHDGEHFWIEISGLTSETEYAFQYLIDETLKIADPYADKVLAPEDSQIPAATYPNLKAIPQQALNSQWYFNRFSVLQTGQTPYQWKTTNYQKPAKEKLVIYELLIRDFFDSNHRNFQSLIDTISYFRKLGINAVELMPVADFNGEIGWGYNPTFMFAPQKYYGTKNKLKEFVDKCHANGIAVIMDIVLNHQDLPNSYAMLDYDFVNGHPTSANKWFNVSAPHPYSVFNDLNHTSPYTRKYIDTINYHWISEYKIDGYRYDLSKGFTQTISTESSAGNYDQSRIDNIKRMADALWSKFPEAYIILEHFTANTEETVLANFRVSEGKGMMLWGNFNYAYGQNTMGYVSGSDISEMYYGTKGWTAPRSVGYMESHDEEREMYRNLQFGNISGTYSVKDLSIALQRMKAANLIFLTIPGPKMIWEFGELGYDKSINTCQDGSVNSNCRLDIKPVPWAYLQDPNRKSLSNFVSNLLSLRKNYPVFTTTGVAQITSGSSSLVQQITLKNTPYTSTPTDSTQMNVQIAANLDVVNQSVSIVFPHAGTWYDYYNGNTAVTGSGVILTMAPGDYKLYTDVPMKGVPLITGVEKKFEPEIILYPNPTHGQLHIDSDESIIDLQVRSVAGSLLRPYRIDDLTWDVTSFSPGLYIVEVRTERGLARRKLVVK